MKRLVVSLLVVGLMTGLVFARLIPYNRKQPPRLPLPEAYSLATQALGAATNQFYCVNASTLVSRSQDGEWLFEFSDTNEVEKHVFVFFDKTTHVESGPLSLM
jgi:hypothetical protein